MRNIVFPSPDERVSGWRVPCKACCIVLAIVLALSPMLFAAPASAASFATATAAGSANGAQASGKPLKVAKTGKSASKRARSIKKAKAAAVKAVVYTGKAVRPKPKLTYAKKRLKAGRDYTLTYKSNVNAGKAVVVIKGKGKFSGKRTIRFTIDPAPLSKAKVASIPWEYTTGLTAVKPLPTVKYLGRVLVKGSDYKLAYKNNVQPGTATVTVKPKSRNFTGSVSKEFKLVNMGDDLARAACEVSYSRKVKAGKGTKQFIAACKAAGCYSSPYYGRSCILGMCTAIRTSGYDTDFPKYNWDSRWTVKSVRSYFHYLRKDEKSSDVSQKSSRWTYIGTYPAKESKLLPGDVLVVLRANGSSSNHIWMYVGDEIANEVYQSSLEGTDADKGEPTGAWVQSHSSTKSAPCIEGANDSYNNSSNPVRIYRCTNPENRQ